MFIPIVLFSQHVDWSNHLFMALSTGCFLPKTSKNNRVPMNFPSKRKDFSIVGLREM